MEFKEIKGNLITLALANSFDVITHGCNCFCNMGAGIAPQMAKAFGANNTRVFMLEKEMMRGDVNKLGAIEIGYYNVDSNTIDDVHDGRIDTFTIINSYTQYDVGRNVLTGGPAIDYEALTMCLRKINFTFKGKHIGLPLIGAGLAGGDWSKIKGIILRELKDMKVTIVHFDDKYLPERK